MKKFSTLFLFMILFTLVASQSWALTTVTFYMEGGTLCGIEGRGHSGFAEKGNDIICAAVSTLLHSLLLGLNDVAGIEGLECEVDSDKPLIRIIWPRERAKDLNLLTRTIALSLREIQLTYPGYVKIKEVRL